MTTSRYLFYKTLWVSLILAFPLYIGMPFFFIYITFILKVFDIITIIVFPIIFPFLIIIPFVIWQRLQWINKNIQHEDIPENFIYCLLPWLIPLYYTSLIALVASLATCMGWKYVIIFFFISQPTYLPLGLLAFDNDWRYIFIVLPFIISLIISIVGFFIIRDEIPPSKHWYWLYMPVLIFGIGIFFTLWCLLFNG